MATRRASSIIDLVRCGETTWDAERRILGSADLPLSEPGRVQAMAMAPRLGTAAGPILHAPDEAARETARLIAEARDVKIRAVTELADPHLGLLEGLTRETFAERFPTRFKQWQDDPMSLSPPEGEDLADARARLLGAVARLARRHRGGELVLVLHELGVGFLRCWLADLPTREMWTVLDQPQRVERYAITAQMLQWLEEAARPATSRT